MKVFTGINIQFPISRLLVDGSKTIETRRYPIPNGYIGRPLAFVETPGKLGKFRSRVIAIITFDSCFEYRDAEHFYADEKRHKVDPTSQWKWLQGQKKWGWKVASVQLLPQPIELMQRKGIIFTKGIKLPL